MDNAIFSSGKVAKITIDASAEQQRIDNLLIKILKGVPKSRIYRMIRKGEVRINGRRVRAEYRLQLSDTVRIPPVRCSLPENKPLANKQLRTQLEHRILFEDDYFIVVNKPSGIPVHGGTGVSSGLIETFRQIRPESKFLELVHRLDRETSGCLLLAKKRNCLLKLHEQFRSNRIKKYYTALLCGRWQKKKQLVDAALKKNIKQSGERMVKVSEDGKTAKTLFRRIDQVKSATLIEAELLTGRTHQIRVHAAHIGHAIAGDERYGNKTDNRFFRGLGLKRLFLHASRLNLIHPISGKALSFFAPLDDNLVKLIHNLKHE